MSRNFCTEKGSCIFCWSRTIGDLAREMAEFFRRRKHAVTTCYSLAEAQVALKNGGADAPEAILCDGNLPDGNGVDFYCQTSSTFAGRWILMSGAHDDHRLALGNGTARERLAIVDKPVSLRELARLLKIA